MAHPMTRLLVSLPLDATACTSFAVFRPTDASVPDRTLPSLPSSSGRELPEWQRERYAQDQSYLACLECKDLRVKVIDRHLGLMQKTLVV